MIGRLISQVRSWRFIINHAGDRSMIDLLKALRDNGIEVTALHNHMLNDQPRLFFMHFWANDDVKKLANGLKAALANVNTAKK
jgi:hypothetical protein